MKIEDIIKILNSYIKRETSDSKISFVIVKEIKSRTVFKIYKEHKIFLYLLYKGKKYLVLENILTEKVSLNQEEAFKHKAELLFLEKIFSKEFFDLLNDIIENKYDGYKIQ